MILLFVFTREARISSYEVAKFCGAWKKTKNAKNQKVGDLR